MHSTASNISTNALQQAAAILPKPPGIGNMKPGQSPQGGGKASFVICEICDGYIKDLDQLRNHMQWMHKVKVKIINSFTYNYVCLLLDHNQ